MLFGIGAGIGQGVGLVLSKVGMTYYEVSIPAGEEMVADLMPFASTFIRAVTGAIGFLCVMAFQKQFHTLATSVRDRKGMNAAVWATITGPFIGVSLSLMAVQYTGGGHCFHVDGTHPRLHHLASPFLLRSESDVQGSGRCLYQCGGGIVVFHLMYL